MTRLLRTILTVTFGIWLVSCGPASGARDTSRPEFIEMTVTVQRVTDRLEEPPVDAISGLTLDNVERDRRIILRATVADDESGLEPVRVTAKPIGTAPRGAKHSAITSTGLWATRWTRSFPAEPHQRAGRRCAT